MEKLNEYIKSLNLTPPATQPKQTACQPKPKSSPAPASKAKDDDDDDIDLFGSDDDEEANKLREKRLAEYSAKKAKSIFFENFYTNY